MKAFTYSEARQNLSQILTLALREDIEIRRRDGAVFSLRSKKPKSKSPFDVQGVATTATSDDILDAVQESRVS